jgi:hypothetical protein
VYQSISGEKSVGDKVKNLHEKDALKSKNLKGQLGLPCVPMNHLEKNQRS